MSTVSARNGNGATGHIIDSLVAVDGTSSHAHANGLSTVGVSHDARPLGNLADMAHYLCLLHGRFPGVIDHAATRSTENAARQWLIQAADAFADERAFLTRVSVSLGPIPSTTGQDACDAAVLQQRHALEMLAQSDRRGCAMGAALTLVLDWWAIRRLLDIAALRVGLAPAKCRLPEKQDTLAVADAIASDENASRAVQFGTRQLLSQHRGLWDLLAARAAIRTHD
jgi:hypothetical protein